jgi:aminopeptidase N
MGLLAADGTELAADRLLVLDSAEQSWHFDGIASRPCLRCCAASRPRCAWTTAWTKRPAGAAGNTTPTPSTAGKPASAWCWAACCRPCTAGEAPVLDAALADALRRMLRDPGAGPGLQGPGADAPANLHRRTAAQRGPAAHPRRARAVARQLAEQLQADWAWAWEQHQVQRAGYRPTRAVRPPCAGQPGAGRCCACTPSAKATPSGRAAPTSASRTPAT